MSGPKKNLQYRTARERSVALLHRKRVILPARSVFPNISFVRLQRSNRVRIARGFGKLLPAGLSLRVKPRRVTFPKTLKIRTFNRRGSVFRQKIESRSRRLFAEHFRSEAGRQIVRSLDLARACGLYTKFRRQAPFEAHRPRLWNKLTLR